MAMKEYDFEKEPTVAVVKKILTDAIKMKATDIHLDPRENDLIIKFRIDGDLNEYTIVPESAKVNIVTRIKILANMNITEALIPQVGSINFNVDNKPQNMRVSTLPVVNGEKVVIHISNYASKIKNLNKLGFKEEDVNKIKDLIKQKNGLILITGGEASGKTTTLYSILKELNNSADNIISIENPVKMKIEGINQVEINPNKGITLQSILRNILLQDPNVIAINELYDEETARDAIRASVTGRLIISTMHTKSIYQTIDTLLNMDVENYLLGSNISGIISQRMVKRLCPSCKVKKQASKYEKLVIKKITGEEIDELCYPEGCEDCQKGYLKQIPITEVIKVEEELKYAITNNKSRELIKNIIYSETESILKTGFDKVIKGETSFEEIMRIIDIKVDLNNDDKNLKDIILGNITEDEFETENKEESNSKKKTKEKKKAPKEEPVVEESDTQEEYEDDDLTEQTTEEETEFTVVEEDTEVEEQEVEESPEEEKQTEEQPEETTEEVTEEVEETEESDESEESVKYEEQVEDETDDSDNPISTNELNALLTNTNIETEAPTPKEFDFNFNYDDDDDDDDFNYGDKYINNF